MIGLLASTLLLGLSPSADRLHIPDHQCILFAYEAEGKQHYAAKLKEGSQTEFEWSFVGPTADIYGSKHKKVGTHSSGPTWTLEDGGRAVAESAPVQKVPGKRPEDIPWLLLRAKPSECSGSLSQVTFVMRVSTSGGAPPAKPPLHLTDRADPHYSAIYLFLGSEQSPISPARLEGGSPRFTR